jgi:uncharacterized protein (DUF1778 family)
MKKKGGLFEYLTVTGVLATGDETLIKQKKVEYIKQYKATWHKNQRKRTCAITLALTPSESQLILDAAKKHKRSKTAFVKAACLAYLNKRYVVPDILAINEIRELLAMNYNALKRLMEDCHFPYQSTSVLINQMAELEGRVLNQLRLPALLEDQIINAIRQNPDYRRVLYELIQTV